MKEIYKNIKESINNFFLPKCSVCDTPVKISGELSLLGQAGKPNVLGSKTMLLDENNALIIQTIFPYQIDPYVRSEVNIALMGTKQILTSTYCSDCSQADNMGN